jgi:hypothetical protein
MSSSTTQELRRRATAGTAAEEEHDSHYLGKGLSARSMLQASPSQSGPVLKLHVPIFYTLLPAFLQRLVSYCLPFMAPSWKPRYLVQLGAYLYKFTNELGKAPKGSPTSVQELEVYLLEDLRDVQGIDDYHALAPTTDNNDYTYISVGTLRKRQYYAISSKEEAQMWVTTLRQARQEAITRSMGHANNQPYPFQYYDGLAQSLVRSKNRIRRKLHESSMREMEMTSVGVGGVAGGAGPMPRGFFG